MMNSLNDPNSITIITQLPASRWQEYKDLRLEALKKFPAAFGSSYEEEVIEPDTFWIDQLKSEQKSIVIAAQKDKELIGMIFVVFNQKIKMRHIAGIHTVYVQSNFTQQGIGYLLLGTALETIQKRTSIKKIKIAAEANNSAALNLYKKCGFVAIGTAKKDLCINGEFFDDILMEKFL